MNDALHPHDSDPPAARDSRDSRDSRDEDDGEFGLRVDWQSEAVRLEAAEFMVATRVEQERRLRIAKDLVQLRDLEQPTA